MSLRHGIGRLAGCVTVLSVWWLRRGVEWLEINVHPPLKRMLRHGVGCLAEGLFEPIPPLRAFGPPVGMTGKGGLHKRPVGCASRGMGFATEGTEGTEATRASQVCSVVSVILCGLSCPCGLFILSVPVRRVASSSSFRVTRCEAERSTADRGTRSSASRSDTTDAVASWRQVPCGRAVRTGPSTPGLRPSGRDDAERGGVARPVKRPAGRGHRWGRSRRPRSRQATAAGTRARPAGCRGSRRRPYRGSPAPRPRRSGPAGTPGRTSGH